LENLKGGKRQFGKLTRRWEKRVYIFFIILLIIRLGICGMDLSGLGQRHLVESDEDGIEFLMP